MLIKFVFINKKEKHFIQELRVKKYFHAGDCLLPGETFYEILKPEPYKGNIWMDWAFFDSPEDVKNNLVKLNSNVNVDTIEIKYL